jgi:hypothetical protein
MQVFVTETDYDIYFTEIKVHSTIAKVRAYLDNLTDLQYSAVHLMDIDGNSIDSATYYEVSYSLADRADFENFITRHWKVNNNEQL